VSSCGPHLRENRRSLRRSGLPPAFFTQCAVCRPAGRIFVKTAVRSGVRGCRPRFSRNARGVVLRAAVFVKTAARSGVPGCRLREKPGAALALSQPVQRSLDVVRFGFGFSTADYVFRGLSLPAGSVSSYAEPMRTFSL
jgi:hypothetical protein